MSWVVWQEDTRPLAGVDVKIPTGCVLWRAARPVLSVVVKLTFEYAYDNAPRAKARLNHTQQTLSLDRLSDLVDAGRNELRYPNDFVAHKPMCDVLLYGHAYAPERRCSMDASIEVDGWARRFQVVGKRPRRQLSLAARHVFQNGKRVREQPLGPVRCDAVLPQCLVPSAVDYAAFQRACEMQQRPWIGGGARVTLDGLSKIRERVEIQLPGYEPQLSLSSGDRGVVPVRLVCDTLWVDTDAEMLVTVWRGMVAAPTEDQGGRLHLALGGFGDEPARSGESAIRHVAKARTEEQVRGEGVILGLHQADGTGQGQEASSAAKRAPQSMGRPEDRAPISLEEYVKVTEAAIKVTDMAPVLSRFALTEPMWVHSSEYWVKRVNEDERVASRMRQLRALERIGEGANA